MKTWIGGEIMILWHLNWVNWYFTAENPPDCVDAAI
jgi:hypothetical protein